MFAANNRSISAGGSGTTMTSTAPTMRIGKIRLRLRDTASRRPVRGWEGILASRCRRTNCERGNRVREMRGGSDTGWAVVCPDLFPDAAQVDESAPRPAIRTDCGKPALQSEIAGRTINAARCVSPEPRDLMQTLQQPPSLDA